MCRATPRSGRVRCIAETPQRRLLVRRLGIILSFFLLSAAYSPASRETGTSLSFFFLRIRRPPRSTLFPSPPLFRSPPVSLSDPAPPISTSSPPPPSALSAEDVSAEPSSVSVSPLAKAAPFTVSPAELVALASVDRKSTRLNSSHQIISYAVFCLKKK